MTADHRATIRLRRVYEPPAPEDGVRILVDRLWPRGISRERAAIDEWMKDIAPSPELRNWFCHKPERFEEFTAAYEQELAADPVRRGLADRLLAMATRQNVTLVYAARDPVHNHAVVLQRWLNRQIRPEREE
jgi:uncharacterized protein YeaO (DUF488 family)